MSSGTSGPTVKLPASRLRRSGPPGATAIDWAWRGALALLAVAGAWLVFVAVRPLPVPAADAVEGDAVPMLSVPRPTDEANDHRRALLAKLSSVNLFDAERESWSTRAQDGSGVDPVAGGGKPGHRTKGGKLPDAKGQQAAGEGAPSVIVRGDALPEDMKQAIAGLALRAVFADGRGKPVAMISRVFAGPNPFLADPFSAGDEFEDKQFPQAKWRVESVEVAERRVVLSRGGVTTALELYPLVAAPKPAPEPAAAVPAGPEVIVRSANEARADLISGGLSEADADRLLLLAGMSEDDAATQARLDDLAAASAATADPNKPAKRKGPPPGMESIIKLMREAAKPVEPTPQEIRPTDDKAPSANPR
jgi:hypothetical protein